MQVDRWKKIEELYQAALAELPENRTEFLKQACADHPSLQREVESLLNLASETGSFLEDSPISFLRDRAPALPSGHKFGNFEILQPIGRGGMGEVYLARDERLRRDVAIKVLPSAVAADRDLKSRLEREARILAALNHPHIAAIYGLEMMDGGHALTMEYVPGLTLADRIARGAIPLPEAMAVALQLAEALEYAHDKGVVHRDLKPANIKITPDGQVKLLDFGLARAAKPTMGSLDRSHPGFVLGTAAYMAPEQASGQPVDKRADIWAFGVVLYEMLIGKRPFVGEPVSDPDWQALPESVPQDIRRVLRRCLERDAKRRLRDIGEARIVAEGYLADPRPDPPATKPARSVVLPLMIGAVLALGLALALWALRIRGHRDQSLIRLDVDLGPDAVLDATWGAGVVLSPDGKRLAFGSLGADGQTRLATRRVDQSEATILAGTEGAREPFFSPDGLWIGFFADFSSAGKIKKVHTDGGGVLTVCEAPWGHGASWSEDGTIIAALDWRRGLSRVSAAGGTPKPLTEPASNETNQRWPQVLPGAKAVLFTDFDPVTGRYDVGVQSLETNSKKVLQRGASYGRYLPSGHLLFIRDAALFAVTMDLALLELTGTAVNVLEDIESISMSGGAEYAFDQSGTLIYGRRRPVRNTLQWLYTSGELRPLLTRPRAYSETRFSPDGKRLALLLQERSRSSVWIYSLAQDAMTHLVDDENGGLAWSPDGKHIAMGRGDGIYLIMSDGSGRPKRLTQGVSDHPGSFTSDGRRLAYIIESSRGDGDLWTVALEFDDHNGVKAGKPEPFLGTAAEENSPAFSPDGRWLAYVSDETGISEVYVRPSPGRAGAGGGKWSISIDGGMFPVWSSDGRQLYFQTLDNRIMVATCASKGGLFHASRPSVWSETRLPSVSAMGQSFDMSPDGRRAVVVVPAPATDTEKARSHQVVFLQNMFDELKRKVRPSASETR